VRLLADSRFAAFLDAAPDAMACVDRDDWIVTVNAQAERLIYLTLPAASLDLER
jgi:PAS domain-containing protein